ncbi:MAG: CHRD domain-containing protein [Verrucomicrobia bacterium]|nr:CHRD domain-containing protein [Verrucomicrobiota bacterium]
MKRYAKCLLAGVCLLAASETTRVRAATVDVMIVGFAYDPPTVTVNVGDTVRWTQIDTIAHTVTSDTGAWPSSPLLSVNQTFSLTFTTAGSYPYHCAPHPFMTGTVNVQGTASNAPPTVSISSPTNGASFAQGASITIQATAADSDGTVAQVQFFEGANSLGVVMASPYTVTTTLPSGSHALTAVATDNEGATTTSAAVNIYVNFVPIPNPIAARVPKGDITIELQTIADGMASPLGMAVPDDGSGRMFVYDQAGTIWVVTAAGRLLTPLLDVRSRLLPSAKWDYDERGLLGLATHPNFAQNPLIYTYTSETNLGSPDFPAMGTNVNHQSIIAEWRIDSANTNRVDPASRREILRIDKPQFNHNGGTMRFGPDGLLYITVGDGGNVNDVGDGHMPGGNAQDTMMILGKLLRIDVDGRNAANGKYGLPVDNPFNGVNGLREIYAYGFRNPFAFSFGRLDGELYLADVGQNRVEEVDVIVKGGNYGWNVKEGTFWFDSVSGTVVTEPTRPVPPGLIDPIAQYDHDDGSAVIGGYEYTGTNVTALAGRYVFGDWGSFGAPSGRLYYLDAANMVNELRIGTEDRSLGLWLKGFGEGPDGELYVFGSRVVGPAGNTGQMLKIVPGPAPISISTYSVPGEGAVDTDWSGGVGPFALQKRTDLKAPAWMNVGFTMSRTAAAAEEGPAGFFRVADLAHQPGIALSAYLSGANERPTPVTTSGTGFGLFSLDGNTLTFSIRYGGLSATATAAHIHGPASAAQSASVAISLVPFNGGAFGSNGTLSGMIVLTDAQKAMILAGQSYVNVHTANNPGGEIRGQIAPVLMQTVLNGANERPDPVSTRANGLGVLLLVGNQLTFNVSYRNFTQVPTAAHIHGPATLGQSAGVMISLVPYNGGAFGTNGTLAGSVTLTADQLAAVIDGLTYVNLHTPAHGGGEIRGQIVPQATAVAFSGPLTGLSERPVPITNNAAGSALFSLEGNQLAFSINYSNLSGAATAAHIHGPATTAQSTGVVVSLVPFNGGSFGTSGTLAGTVTLTPAQRDMIKNGLAYVNVHTTANPGGEIRAQIAPVLLRAYLSGASERPTPVFSDGAGFANFALVLDQLSLCIAYGGLNSAANNSHIHGPATVTQSAGVIVNLAPFNGGGFGVAGSMAGTVTLTTSQLGNILDGLTYVNIHTATSSGGEIRGHITR